MYVISRKKMTIESNGQLNNNNPIPQADNAKKASELAGRTVTSTLTHTGAAPEIFKRVITTPEPSTDSDSDSDYGDITESTDSETTSTSSSPVSHPSDLTPIKEMKGLIVRNSSVLIFNILNSMILGDKNLQSIEDITKPGELYSRTFKLILNAPIDLAIPEGPLKTLLGEDLMKWIHRALGSVATAKISIPEELIIKLSHGPTSKNETSYSSVEFPEPKKGFKFTNIANSLPEIGIKKIYCEHRIGSHNGQAFFQFEKPKTINSFILKAALALLNFDQLLPVNTILALNTFFADAWKDSSLKK